MKLKLSIENLTFEHIDFCDCYIKKVISNAKRYFYRPKIKIKKHNIILLNLDTQLETLQYEDREFENIFTTHIWINKTDIPVHNSDLAEALLELSEIQRESVLRSVVLGDKLIDIARDNKVSVPMISKHKNNALKFIKQRMLNEKWKRKQKFLLQI